MAQFSHSNRQKSLEGEVIGCRPEALLRERSGVLLQLKPSQALLPSLVQPSLGHYYQFFWAGFLELFFVPWLCSSPNRWISDNIVLACPYNASSFGEIWCKVPSLFVAESSEIFANYLLQCLEVPIFCRRFPTSWIITINESPFTWNWSKFIGWLIRNISIHPNRRPWDPSIDVFTSRPHKMNPLT